jgi:hypothetical protein
VFGQPRLCGFLIYRGLSPVHHSSDRFIYAAFLSRIFEAVLRATAVFIDKLDARILEGAPYDRA